MKVVTLIAVFTFLPISNAYAKECKIFTSQPDYSKMKLITADSRWQSIPIVSGKPMKFISFSDAYKKFYDNLITGIKDDCKKYKQMKGVVNLNIQHSVSKDWYYFTATYDAYE